MPGQIRVNTEQVGQIASSIEKLNKRLTEELNTSRQTIKNLSSTWEGAAAQETISAFDGFAEKYFQTYEDTITQYVKFLRTNVEQGFTETESVNESLAEAFK